MYEECKKRNITLLTVSHRKSLWKYHEWCVCSARSSPSLAL